jgi:hypothetical protein
VGRFQRQCLPDGLRRIFSVTSDILSSQNKGIFFSHFQRSKNSHYNCFC